MYSTLAFAPVATNPSGLVSNSPQMTSSATINGVATPLSGFQVLARSGWVDTNGNVLGLILVRACAGSCVARVMLRDLAQHAGCAVCFALRHISC